MRYGDFQIGDLVVPQNTDFVGLIISKKQEEYTVSLRVLWIESTTKTFISNFAGGHDSNPSWKLVQSIKSTQL